MSSAPARRPSGVRMGSRAALLAAALALACSKPSSGPEPSRAPEAQALAAEAPAAPAPAAAPNDDAVKACLDSALQLVESARAETAGFGEGPANLATPAPEAQARLAQWRAWVPGWKSRVEAAKACLPPAAPGTDALYMWANGGYDMLAEPPTPGAGAFVNGPDTEPYLPGRAAREAWLDASKSRFEKAQSFVGRVAKPRDDL